MMTSNCIIFTQYFTLILEVLFDVVIKNILPNKWPYFIAEMLIFVATQIPIVHCHLVKSNPGKILCSSFICLKITFDKEIK